TMSGSPGTGSITSTRWPRASQAERRASHWARAFAGSTGADGPIQGVMAETPPRQVGGHLRECRGVAVRRVGVRVVARGYESAGSARTAIRCASGPRFLRYRAEG